MGHKAGKGNSHNDLVKILQLRLYQEQNYDELSLFIDYCRNGVVGEVDILAAAGNIWDFYEVKTRRTNKSVKTAHEQYDRFKIAFPSRANDGYLFTGNKGLENL